MDPSKLRGLLVTRPSRDDLLTRFPRIQTVSQFFSSLPVLCSRLIR